MAVDHLAVQLALRSRLLTLSVLTTGSGTFAATTSGYTRTSGSFVTDGFAPGMEVTPSGFATNTARVVTAVAALTLTVSATLTAETAAAARTLAVRLPTSRAWENIPLTPTTGTPFVEENYLPGPTQQITLGATGELEVLPMYVVKVYVAQNVGVMAAHKYADAILALFAPRQSVILTTGTLAVRTDVGSFRSQFTQVTPGFAVVSVSVPLRYRVANSI